MEPNWQLARRRPIIEKRARIVQAIRAFFIERSFLEVETPLRIPANAPEQHIDAIPADGWFLQTSPELAMKRLLAAGYGDIFQISHCWRKGERGNRHLPEYSMLEWYRPDCDYQVLMDDCEALLKTLCADSTLIYQGEKIDISAPWPRITVVEAFQRFATVPLQEALAQGRFDTVISEEIEPNLPKNKPTFLIEYPASQAALARVSERNPHVAERFELYIGGLELANAFSELTDQKEQERRFSEEEQLRRAAGKQAYPAARNFLDELACLAPSAGIALGIDRLVMLLCDSRTIDEVVAIPPELL